MDRFGATAVFGNRAVSVSELRSISVAGRIAAAYDARAASESWAEWASKNRADNSLLNSAMAQAEALRK